MTLIITTSDGRKVHFALSPNGHLQHGALEYLATESISSAQVVQD